MDIQFGYNAIRKCSLKDSKVYRRNILTSLVSAYGVQWKHLGETEYIWFWGVYFLSKPFKSKQNVGFEKSKGM